MRNLLALIGAVVVGFAVLGWYLGWYQLSLTKTNDGKIRVETDVNTKKVVEDSGDAIQSAGSYINSHLDKAGQDAKAGQQPAPATTPGPAEAPKSGVWLFGIDLTPKSGK